MSGKKTIIKSTTAVVLVMLCSKLLGFLRQAAIAGVFGSNSSTDIYFISSEFMINVSGAFTTALTTALVTVYIAIAATDGKKSAGQVASRVLTMFLMAAAVLVVVLDLFANQVGSLLAPAYDAARLQQLTHYLRLFSAAFIFSAFQSIYAAVLNANEIYVPGKLYGVVFSPLAILAIVLWGDCLGISALVYAYYLANVLQIIFLHVRCRGLYSFRPSLSFQDERLKQVGRLALPILISNVVIQFDGVVDKAICSYLGNGVASSYTYAHTLEQFVTGTFTATITMVLLSRFASLAAKHDGENMRLTLEKSVSAMILILAPVTLIAMLCAGDIVTVVYKRGEFTAENVTVTAMALLGFAIGFPLVALREIMIRVHFAYQKTQLPMVISICSVALNVVLSLVLSRFVGILGVTAATSLSSILSVVLLVMTSKRYLPEFRFFSCWRTLLKCAGALAAAAAVVVLIGRMSPLSAFLRTVVEIVSGCCVYVLALLVLRCRELLELLQAAKGKLRKQA
jgi:putative peptidoglycan lipid II flippase